MLEAQRGEAALFPYQVKDFLQQAIQLGRARELAIDVWGERYWQRAIRDTEQQLAELLEPVQSDPSNQRLRKHLRKHQHEVLVFLHNPAVAPTNNLAEREIRPAVVMRKVSAGNRSEAGAHAHEVLASITRTTERCGMRFPDLLPELLRSPGPVVITPKRLGLPTLHAPPSPEATHVRRQRRRGRRVDRAHRPTAPP